MKLASLFVCLLLFIVAAQADVHVQIMNVYKNDEYVKLDCGSIENPVWYVIKPNATEEALEDREKILTIKDFKESDVLNKYSCRSQNGEKVEFVLAPKLSLKVLEKKLHRVVEGGYFSVKCEIEFGNLDNQTKWEWKLNDERLEVTDRVNITSVIDSSELIIRKVGATEIGTLTCNATNQAGSEVLLVEVQVKSAFNAFWPFLIITGQVAAIATTVMIIEKRCSNKKKE